MDSKAKQRELFFSFMKIGLFTFGGGFAMIPLIKKEIIEKREWIEEDNFLELLTLAQSAPGPLALNSAVFVGYRVAGYRGALSSIVGVIIPSFVIILLIAMFFHNVKDNAVVVAAFKGMRPAVVALIVAPIFSLAKGLGFWRIVLALAVAVVIWYFDISPIYCIIVGAIGGILYTFYNNRKNLER